MVLLSPRLQVREARGSGTGLGRENLCPHSEQTGPSHEQKAGGCMGAAHPSSEQLWPC